MIYAGFSKESARSFIENFELYLENNKERIEALRVTYNLEDKIITHSMLTDMQEQMLSENSQYTPYQVWKNYRVLDDLGDVDEPDLKTNVNALTNMLQIIRFAFGKNQKLTSIFKGYSQRFSLYCGQAQRVLTDDQKDIMKQIGDYVINDGAITVDELNEIDTDLWRKGVLNFGVPMLTEEMNKMSRFVLRA